MPHLVYLFLRCLSGERLDFSHYQAVQLYTTNAYLERLNFYRILNTL